MKGSPWGSSLQVTTMPRSGPMETRPAPSPSRWRVALGHQCWTSPGVSTFCGCQKKSSGREEWLSPAMGMGQCVRKCCSSWWPPEGWPEPSVRPSAVHREVLGAPSWSPPGTCLRLSIPSVWTFLSTWSLSTLSC
jgi:hypothetical protein